jgi:isopenicillin N synthase-like dioxygenase
MQIPVIDLHPLMSYEGDRTAVAAATHSACREHGFFYIAGHGVDEELQNRIEDLSRRFFAQDHDTKMQIRMAFGGRAWRGYFPVGAELTSGKPDQKEGIYFGAELDDDHPMVRANAPMHGRNLFPEHPHQLRETVLEYMSVMTQLAHTVMRGIALSLDLEESYFSDRYTADPLILFRIFNYAPNPLATSNKQLWSVGEHTDYGLLTILKQDDCGGLQIRSKQRWIDAPPIPNTFVCNIGDMLDRMTGGLYRSTPHRVRNLAERDRLSFPFFFDPNFNAEVQPIKLHYPLPDDQQERWDKASVHAFQGTYGKYVLNKVGKVFPELRQAVID